MENYANALNKQILMNKQINVGSSALQQIVLFGTSNTSIPINLSNEYVEHEIQLHLTDQEKISHQIPR